jgi:hypothetical protein
VRTPLTGTHMIVLPGGGDAAYAPHEAEPVATWLGEHEAGQRLDPRTGGTIEMNAGPEDTVLGVTG